MTLQKAKAILAHKEDYDQDKIDEAQKFIDTNQGASVNMSIDKARAILDHKEDYEQDKIDQAKAVVARHRPAPGKWIGKYMPINKEGGFNFNWRQAYNKPIKNDEDVQKLDDWKNTQVWDVDDKIDLRDVATDMDFKHTDEGWEDFIKSDRFPIFQDFLKDVQNTQKQKMVDKIWSGEEPSQQWTPFGYKEVPGAMLAVDFTAPVTKEYARKNYENINGVGDMAAPLTVDALTNAAMMGSGKVAGKIANPIAKDLVANASAPVISSVGDAIVNDKDAGDASLGTILGYGANKAVPKALMGLGRWGFGGQRQAAPTVKSVYGKASEALDDAVNQARKQADVEAKSIVRESPDVYKDYGNLDKAKFINQIYDKVPYLNKIVEKEKILPKPLAYTDDLSEKAIAEEEGFIVKNLKDMPTKKSVVDRLNLDKNVYEPELSKRTNKDIFKKSNRKPDYTAEPPKPNKNALGGDLVAEMRYENFLEALDKLRSGKATAKDWQDNYDAMEKASRYLGLPTMESLGNWAKANLGMTTDYLSNIPGSNPRQRNRFLNSILGILPPGVYDRQKAEKEKKTEELKRIYGL